MKKKSVIFSIIVIIAGCTTLNKLQPAQEEIPLMQQKVPGITYEKAMKGFVLYKNYCSGCHRLHRPGEYRIAEWEKILPEMVAKAKLTNSEELQLLKDYLFSKSK